MKLNPKQMSDMKGKIEKIIPPPTYQVAYNKETDEMAVAFSDGRILKSKFDDFCKKHGHEMKEILKLPPWQELTIVVDDLGEDWGDKDKTE